VNGKGHRSGSLDADSNMTHEPDHHPYLARFESDQSLELDDAGMLQFAT
jgi:hypothetical protein